MATKENWEDVLRTNYTDLLKNVDASDTGGLYGALKKADVFTNMCLRSYWGTKDETKRIDSMLRSLQKRDFSSFKRFCRALEISKQPHIIEKHLSAVKMPQSGDATMTTDSADTHYNQSLSGVKLACLKNNWNEIIDHVDCSEHLLAEIGSRDIFTPIQLNKLRQTEEDGKRVDMMLRCLERGSQRQYDRFCDALVASKQSHIVAEYMTYPFRRSAANPRPPEPESKENAENIGGGGGDAENLDHRFFHPSDDFSEKIEKEVATKIAYKCDSVPLGRAIIINNKKFKGLDARDGADQDEINLKSLFDDLKFETTFRTNLDSTEMLSYLDDERRKLTDSESETGDNRYDVFLLFILSHGESGNVYGSDDVVVPIDRITSLFDGKGCRGLIGKPKLFFIQACQGSVKSEGVTQSDCASDSTSTEVSSSSADVSLSKDLNVLTLLDDVLPNVVSDAAPDVVPQTFQSDAVTDKETIHEKADIAVFHATVDGQVAWRHKSHGSLFVQCILDVFSKQAHKDDLMTMMLQVNNKLHEINVDEDGKVYKVIGQKKDTLRRKVYMQPMTKPH